MIMMSFSHLRTSYLVFTDTDFEGSDSATMIMMKVYKYKDVVESIIK